MRRDPVFWVALAVAFVLGLLPGLGLMAYQRTSTGRGEAAARAELHAKQTAWEAERRTLNERLASAETSADELETQVASLTAHVTKLKSVPSAEEPVEETRKPPLIIDRSVEGLTKPGKPITLVVRVQGEADKVTMRIARIPDSGYLKTFALEDTGETAGVHVWRATVTCPPAGQYRYFADAYLGTSHVSMPGVSAWTFLSE